MIGFSVFIGGVGVQSNPKLLGDPFSLSGIFAISEKNTVKFLREKLFQFCVILKWNGI